MLTWTIGRTKHQMVEALNRLHGAAWSHFDPTPCKTTNKEGAKQNQGTYADHTEKPESFRLHLRNRGDNWGSHLSLGGNGEFWVVYCKMEWLVRGNRETKRGQTGGGKRGHNFDKDQILYEKRCRPKNTDKTTFFAQKLYLNKFRIVLIISCEFLQINC